MEFFDSEVEMKYPKELRGIMKMLGQRATEAAPQFPQRQVAGAGALEQLAGQLTQGYMTAGPSDAYSTALAEATKTATTPVDVANMPEYQALLNRIGAYGQTEANRLQRGNILTGNPSWRSTAGRDVLGRSVTETQERMMAAAVPFLQQARSEKQQAVEQLGQLEQMGQARTLSQISAGSQVGQMLRTIDQAKLEAEYQNLMDPLRFRYETQPGVAGVAAGVPFAKTEQPSEYEKWVLGLGSAGNVLQGLFG